MFIATPISWHVLTYLLLVTVLAAAVFLSFASYSRVEVADGTIRPDKGVANILPQRNGTIIELPIESGQYVEAGEVLAVIRTEADSEDALSSTAQAELEISRQEASLDAQVEAVAVAASAQQMQLAAQQTGLSAEIESLRSQILLQRELVENAQIDLERALEVADRGFISGRDLREREETLVSRRQRLSQLGQELSLKASTLAESRRSSEVLSAQARANRANLAITRAQIGQQAANTAGLRSYAIRAPISGNITALTARVGQQADLQRPLMALVPANAELQAELQVPSSAIGFVEEGQKVRLAIHAFPYQRFGTIDGRVRTVAASPLGGRDAEDAIGSVYPVIVVLETASIRAYGRREPLLPGMTFSTRIITEEQSLVEWLFEPLFAVSRRE